jgi:hypothetical protein
MADKTFTITDEEVGILEKALIAMPYGQVFNLIPKLREQFWAQAEAERTEIALEEESKEE